MVTPQLLSYIQQQQRAGRPEAQIRQTLLANRYTPEMIDEAFAAIGQAPKGASVLHDTAQVYAQQGMSAEQVQQYMLQQGYPPESVKRAVQETYAPEKRHSPIAITLSFIVFALLIGAGGMYIVLDNEPAPDPTGGVPIVTFSPSEIISNVVETARVEGKEAGLDGCLTRLKGRDRDICYQNIATIEEFADMQVCEKIQDATVYDSCLMNFLNTDFDSVCAKAKLAETKQTCASIKALRA